ncbi:MAG: hypothetical protein ACREFL_17660, partial [Stellaceae bacterium]
AFARPLGELGFDLVKPCEVEQRGAHFRCRRPRRHIEMAIPLLQKLFDLRAQEARVAALEKRGPAADTATKLLETMKQTQALHLEHVLLLKRELAEFES